MKPTQNDLDKWTVDAAGKLPPVAGLNNTALLRAICRVESAYGALAIPRHETGWCPNSNRTLGHVVRVRFREFGCLACCSYGPMQALFHTLVDNKLADDPMALLHPMYAFDKSVALLALKTTRYKPANLAEIGDMWNTGNPRDGIIPHHYISHLQQYYTRDLEMLKGVTP